MKRIVVAVLLVMTVGCSSSRSYEFYPDGNIHQADTQFPQNVDCGHVDLVIQTSWNQEHIEVGRFCREENGR